MIEAYSGKVRSARMDQKSKRDSALLAITVRCVALVGLLMLGRASGEAQPPVRQVLLLQSFDRGNMIVDHFTGNLRVDLDRNVGSPVNVVQVVVGPTGFVGASEQAIVEFIDSAYAARPKPDLIVSLGGPASLFARKFRQQLFPAVPLLIAAIDQRWLGDTPLGANVTAVASSNDFAGSVEDILQLLPETKQVFMVLGSGQSGRVWHQEFSQQFTRFRDRVGFIWSDEMSLAEILRRCASLPDHSAIFYVMFGTDAAGAAYADERVLSDLHAAANAPLFAAHGVYMGSGIVGGRLTSMDDLPRHTADAALRLLNGESPGSIRVLPLSRDPPIFDWRELQRWGIPESRLPSDSVVLYRHPSVWREYPRTILSVAGALAIQALLIIGLLFERRARQRAEIDSRRNLALAADSEERMSLAVESAQLALWDWDVTNDSVWMTDEARKFLGFEPGELIHFSKLASLDGRVHPDDRVARATAIQRAMETRGSYEVEYRLISPDGSVRWISSRGHPSPDANNAPRILGVSMDITRQKQADADVLLQREELAHLSRAATLSVLSGSLAHELSQPLTSILVNAQAGQLCMSQDAPDPVEIRAIFADIVSAECRAGEIIEGLRAMLRRGQVALQPVSVKDSLEELLRLTRSDLITRGVSVSNLTTSDLPPAMTDRVQLQQVLLNLIVNACDAMESNPPEDRILTLTTFVAQDEICISVLDRGVGLPDDVETLFQPFHSTKDGGLGLGLSICRTLMTSHGGRLWAERRAERGAAFYVALPLAKENSA